MPEGFETVDMTDPRQHLAWALGSMPSHTPGGHAVAIPPMVVPEWSKQLHALGFRHDPDQQTLFPIAGEQPGMGWMSPIQWVSREKYDEHLAAKEPAKDVDLNSLLAAVDPDLAQKIAAMSDVEKREAMAEQAAKIPGVIEGLAQMRKQFEQGIES